VAEPTVPVPVPRYTFTLPNPPFSLLARSAWPSPSKSAATSCTSTLLAICWLTVKEPVPVPRRRKIGPLPLVVQPSAARSIRPSSSKSAEVRSQAPHPPGSMVVTTDPNPPAPFPGAVAMPPLNAAGPWFARAASVCPSPSKSPTATSWGSTPMVRAIDGTTKLGAVAARAIGASTLMSRAEANIGVTDPFIARRIPFRITATPSSKIYARPVRPDRC